MKRVAKFKIKTLILSSLLAFLVVQGQEREFPFSFANTCLFAGHIYCFGIQEDGKESNLMIHQLNTSFETQNLHRFRLQIKAGLEKSRCWADTLHDFLNIYVPEGTRQTVSIFRFNRNFELIKEVKGVDLARLYPISGFENQLYYYGNTVYAVQTQSEKDGLQYYINKYELKPEFDSFEYDYKWQFPFERKNVRSAQLFFANRDFMMVFVHVSAGPKSGQWILKLNAGNGNLIKGTKLNGKTDVSSYMYGSHFFETSSKTLLLCGHKFTAKEYSSETSRLNLNGSTAVGLYLIALDSIGDIHHRQELKFGLAETRLAGKKPSSAYLLQMISFNKIQENNYQLSCDLYKGPFSSTCFTYANSFDFKFKLENEIYVPEKKLIESNPNIDSYLNSNDKLDMNGKICTDSTGHIEQLFKKKPSSPVKLAFLSDSLQRPIWILCKNNGRKASINFSVLKVQKNIYQLFTIEDIPVKLDPVSILVNNQHLILGTQADQDKYRLSYHKP